MWCHDHIFLPSAMMLRSLSMYPHRAHPFCHVCVSHTITDSCLPFHVAHIAYLPMLPSMSCSLFLRKQSLSLCRARWIFVFCAATHLLWCHHGISLPSCHP